MAHRRRRHRASMCERLTARYADRVRLNCGASRDRAARCAASWIEDETGALVALRPCRHRDPRGRSAGACWTIPSAAGARAARRLPLPGQPAPSCISDASLMPRRRARLVELELSARRRRRCRRAASRVTYWMNRLQGLDPREPLFVTLNPPREPRAGRCWASSAIDHPLFDAAATRGAEAAVGLCRAGATPGSAAPISAPGFHEDGLQAGLAVAEQLGGVRRPWDVPGESDRIHAAAAASGGGRNDARSRALYVGTVMHHRLRSRSGTACATGVFSLLVDLDELPDAGAAAEAVLAQPVQPVLASMDRDFGAGDGSALQALGRSAAGATPGWRPAASGSACSAIRASWAMLSIR